MDKQILIISKMNYETRMGKFPRKYAVRPTNAKYWKKDKDGFWYNKNEFVLLEIK